ncbi:MAG: hypothetical protein Q7S84_04225 [bacterium]|nr:hypothetical protein [bacterium]
MRHFIISFLIAGIVTAGLFVPRAPASALAVPVFDPAHTGTTAGGWVAQAVRFTLEQTLKALLETLKKRLLDTMTDQVITWIQGGGEPRFVQNFGDVLGDAGSIAVDATVRELRQVEFFDPALLSMLEGGVAAGATRSFVERLTPTLPDVVPSVQQFRGNFDAGGFLAYRELFNPQNNPWGLQMLVEDEVIRKAAAETEKAKIEQVAEQGFEGQKRCLLWTRSVLMQSGPDVEQTFQPGDTGWLEQFYNLKTPPTGRPLPPNPVPGIYPWLCEPGNQERTTPGSAIAEGVRRSLFTDVDYVANSDSLGKYLAAIMDAAFNRMIRDAGGAAERLVRGFAGLEKSQTGRPQSQQFIPPLPETPSGLLEGSQGGYTSGTISIQQQEIAALNDMKQLLLSTIDRLKQNLTTIRQTLIDTLAADQAGLRALTYGLTPRGLFQCFTQDPLDPTRTPPPSFVPPNLSITTISSHVSQMSLAATTRRNDINTNKIPSLNATTTHANILRGQIAATVLPRDRDLLMNSFRVSVQNLENDIGSFEGSVQTVALASQTFKNNTLQNLAECERTRLTPL